MSIKNNLKKVMTGTAISQIIAVLSIPIITNIYSPEELGFYAIGLSLVSIIGMVSSLRLERPLFKLYGTNQYNQRIGSIVLVSFFVSLIMTGVIHVAIMLGVIDFKVDYIPLIFVWGFFCSLIQVFTVVCSSSGFFSEVSKSAIIRSVIFFGCQISFVYFFENNLALILSALFSSAFCFFTLKSNVKFDVSMARFFIFIKSRRNRLDAINGLFQSLFSSINNNIGLLVISQLWGIQVAGLFMLSEKLIRVPINLISNNLRPVSAKHFQAEENRNLRSVIKISMYTSSVSIIIVLLVFILSDYIIVNFLSAEWRDTSNMIKIMSFWVVANFIALPFQSFNLHYLNMKYTTWSELLALIFKIILLYLGFVFDVGYEAVCVIVVLSSFFYALVSITITTLYFMKNTFTN
ncbi:lipopolysaccharide biosynthesis protein [Vibrio diabolicus]|uniref:lipopolysaccharide biosynthesis protein n=1 Tax=Vibrio diabolicus TaxID=50719 RepID=UPI002150DEC5|nr:oligosaccharide flippase family protein [Vibrio diabolicus]ELA8259777.1 oligosaccharide flippase family protein [Vibrio alginolyticus]MCE9831961.1 oligosaccharide flippase family protein [Vibrio diabolicus]MCS0314898.1 oligosaccharide flippase family protein [Vibrio diabolicus]